jgi:hypothetical protein
LAILDKEYRGGANASTCLLPAIQIIIANSDRRLPPLSAGFVAHANKTVLKATDHHRVFAYVDELVSKGRQIPKTVNLMVLSLAVSKNEVEPAAAR